ncbi:hypothetical protein [Neisseria musculi]|uniref:hypothetical protein n=1 Tax=Neisseria musculi TaxID=1815583 RepID=UPI00164BD9F7|nr:hypothetical protein [Neisseria musculi]
MNPLGFGCGVACLGCGKRFCRQRKRQQNRFRICSIARSVPPCVENKADSIYCYIAAVGLMPEMWIRAIVMDKQAV